MDEQQQSELLSRQVDELLAGRDSAAEDGLPALAAELMLPAGVQPPTQFSQRLHQRLVTEPVRRSQLWRSWSLAGAAVTVLLVVAVVLVWTPQSLSAAEVLDRIGETVALESGQVIHEVLLIEYEGDGQPAQNPALSTMQESWYVVGGGDAQPGDVINLGAVYLMDDAKQDVLQNRFVFSLERACFYDYSLEFCESETKVDGCGCDCQDISDQNYYPPLAGDRWQDWFERALENLPNVRYAKTRWEGRRVHRLSMSGVATQTKRLCYGDECASEQYLVNYESTAYFDRDTYLPVAAEYEDSRDMQFTLTYLTFEVLEPEELPADLFVWPQGPCEEMD